MFVAVDDELPPSHVTTALQDAWKLAQKDNPEDEPYKYKYDASQLLADTIAHLDDAAVEDGSIALLSVLRGIILLDTDLLRDGEGAIQQHTGQLEAMQAHRVHRAVLMRAYNALGCLYFNRSAFDEALATLAKCKALFSSLPSDLPADEAAAVGTVHTQTLYYMAQCYAASGHPDRAAAFCAMTLNRQAAHGAVDVEEWVANCSQLSTFFVERRQYGAAEYCLRAAEAMAQQAAAAAAAAGVAGAAAAADIAAAGPAAAAVAVDTAAAAAADGCVGGDGGGAADGAAAAGALREGGGGGGDSMPTAAPGVGPPEEGGGGGGDGGGGGGGLPEEGGGGDGGGSGGLPEELQASLQVQWGELYKKLLLNSYTLHTQPLSGEGKEGGAGEGRGGGSPPSGTKVPVLQHIEFKTLGLPPLSTFLEGGARLARSFPEARELFNKGLPRFKAALAFYQLDGWVTEHVSLKLDICNMYRCLAAFEADPHRKCAMHRQRVKQLEPLCGQLSEDAFLGLCRSMDFEMAAAARDILEVKEQEGGQPAKVAAAARAAATCFERFVRSYEVKGKLPEKLPEGHEGVFLSACFNLGRIMHRMQPTAGAQALKAAELSVHCLRWAAAYVKRHDLRERMEEAGLASDLADLVQSKLSLLQRSLQQ